MTFNTSVLDGALTNKYLYNGKEKQELTDWYDYGARMYDAALGRFLAIDEHVEKYPNLCPFGFVANNPVNMIDPNGMDLRWAKYKNLSDDQKNQMTKAEFREAKKQAKYEFRELKRRSSTAKDVIKDLRRDDNTHTITVVTQTDDNQSSSNTDDNGNSNIIFNINGDPLPGLEGSSQDVNNMVSLGHEMAHSWRDAFKLDPPKMKISLNTNLTKLFNYENTVRRPASEKGASTIENMIRSELNVPLRDKYQGYKQGVNYYDLKNDSYNYYQKHDIHEFYGVNPMRYRIKLFRRKSK